MAEKTKKYALGGRLGSVRQAGVASGRKINFPARGERPFNTKPTGPVASPSQMISTLANRANPTPALAPARPSIQDALKNAPRVTPQIQAMADMASAIARGPRPNPLNPTGSLNGPRFGGMGMKKGGKVKAKSMASGGKVSSASKRADGCVMKGKTKGKII
jgi:hypothetical protein